MESALSLFESPDLKNVIKSQFKKIKESNMTPDSILIALGNELNEKYTVTKTNYELIVKADKRKNLEHVRAEVQTILNDVQVSFDMKYLFNVLIGQNEVIVRARRKR
jgi:predicted membrane chloride channel (bestrophin family)